MTEMDHITASSFWRYEPESGLLYWKIHRPKVGKSGLAGTLNNERRVIVGLKGRRYYAHRIAWVLMTRGAAPGVIDHINGDPSDNRWCNLRESDSTSNQGNRRNAPKGVTKRPYGRYEANIRVCGKKRYLGVFSSPEEAHLVYVKAHIETHGNYSSFAGRS